MGSFIQFGFFLYLGVFPGFNGNALNLAYFLVLGATTTSSLAYFLVSKRMKYLFPCFHDFTLFMILHFSRTSQEDAKKNENYAEAMKIYEQNVKIALNNGQS